MTLSVDPFDFYGPDSENETHHQACNELLVAMRERWNVCATPSVVPPKKMCQATSLYEKGTAKNIGIRLASNERKEVRAILDIQMEGYIRDAHEYSVGYVRFDVPEKVTAKALESISGWARRVIYTMSIFPRVEELKRMHTNVLTQTIRLHDILPMEKARMLAALKKRVATTEVMAGNLRKGRTPLGKSF